MPTRLFAELAAWRTSQGPTVEIEELPDAEPYPVVLLRGTVHGDVCVIADTGSRYLLRAHGSTLVTEIEPRSGVLAALLQRFDRGPLVEVRASEDGVDAGAWLEVDGFAVLTGLEHPLRTRVRMRRSGWHEERRPLR